MRALSFSIFTATVYTSHAFPGKAPPSSQKRTLVDLLCATKSVPVPTEMTEDQLDFTIGYLNKHHSRSLVAIAETFSELGREKQKRFRPRFQLETARLISVSSQDLEMEVSVRHRKENNVKVELIRMSLDADPVYASPDCASFPVGPEMEHPVDNLVRKLNRFFWIIGESCATGKLIQMGIQIGGSGVGYLKENLYLNQVPHNRYVRQYFYGMATEAVFEAVVKCSYGELTNRMKLVAMFPELNPSMDSYRIGTLLEMVRSIAIRLAEENLRVRVCVQGSMGVGIFTGIPKQLNGVATLLQRMDWQSGPGEMNEGMVGEFVNFGKIGKDHVVNAGLDENGKEIEQDDVFLLICPQSMQGVDSSIIGPLQEMVVAAGNRPIILINPDLTDKPSAQMQQSYRGRNERLKFAESFDTIFHFQNLYMSGTSYFPILGSLTKLKPSHPWVAHQRRDRIQNGGEVYVPMICSEEKPDGEAILACFEK